MNHPERELRSMLEGRAKEIEPSTAVPSGTLGRMRRRRAGVSVAGGAFIALLVVGAALAVRQMSLTEAAPDIADRDRNVAIEDQGEPIAKGRIGKHSWWMFAFTRVIGEEHDSCIGLDIGDRPGSGGTGGCFSGRPPQGTNGMGQMVAFPDHLAKVPDEVVVTGLTFEPATDVAIELRDGSSVPAVLRGPVKNMDSDLRFFFAHAPLEEAVEIVARRDGEVLGRAPVDPFQVSGPFGSRGIVVDKGRLDGNRWTLEAEQVGETICMRFRIGEGRHSSEWDNCGLYSALEFDEAVASPPLPSGKPGISFVVGIARQTVGGVALRHGRAGLVEMIEAPRAVEAPVQFFVAAGSTKQMTGIAVYDQEGILLEEHPL